MLLITQFFNVDIYIYIFAGLFIIYDILHLTALLLAFI